MVRRIIVPDFLIRVLHRREVVMVFNHKGVLHEHVDGVFLISKLGTCGEQKHRREEERGGIYMRGSVCAGGLRPMMDVTSSIISVASF